MGDTPLETEARRLLNIGGINPSEIEIVSCDPKDPARTDDDICVVRERAASEASDSEGRTREVPVDGLFSLANLRNLQRGTPREQDHKNYFFRLDPNLVLVRAGSVTNAGFMDDGILYRAPGTLEWKRLDYKQIEASPAVKAALLPILRRTIETRAEYDRLNGSVRSDARVDYDYARTKAVSWLINLAPKNDPETTRVLLQAFPSLNPEAARLASFRLKGEIKDVPPEDWSLDPTFRPGLAWEMGGGVYVPFPFREFGGEREPVGSIVMGGIGAKVCYGPRIDCARDMGLRFGAMAEMGRMLNGFGYYYFGGKLYVGNETIVGFAEVAAALYPTGGWMREGAPGELVWKPSLGGGVRVLPHREYFPMSLFAGARMDPTEVKNSGAYFALGGSQ